MMSDSNIIVNFLNRKNAAGEGLSCVAAAGLLVDTLGIRTVAYKDDRVIIRASEVGVQKLENALSDEFGINVIVARSSRNQHSVEMSKSAILEQGTLAAILIDELPLLASSSIEETVSSTRPSGTVEKIYNVRPASPDVRTHQQ